MSARSGGARLRVAALLMTAVAAAAAVAAGSAPAHAQELTGVALGPEGEPLDGLPVVLHRVGGGGGAFVATDTTGPEGGFRFALDAEQGGVYFAALRYEGRMYIGPAAEAGGEPVSGYILEVDPANEAGAVASALSGNAPPPSPARPAPQTRSRATGRSDTGALLLVGLLALAVAGAFLYAAPRYRHRRTVDAVIELAEVENALAEADPDEDREWLEATRDRLRKQLAPRS